MKAPIIAALATMSMLVTVAQAQAGNLLTNGSFEAGNFTGWTLSGATDHTFVENGSFDGFSAQDGWAFAALGPVGADGVLSQAFSDTPGQLYEATFAVAFDGATQNDFSVTGPGGLTLSLTDQGISGWVNYYGYFIGSGVDSISFSYRNDNGYLALDTVGVYVAGAPEPATWALMIVGIGGMGAALRARRRKMPV